MLRRQNGPAVSGLLQLWRTATGPSPAASAQLPALLQRPDLALSNIASLRDVGLAPLRRWFSGSPSSWAAGDAAGREFVTLNTISDNPGATKTVRVWCLPPDALPATRSARPCEPPPPPTPQCPPRSLTPCPSSCVLRRRGAWGAA
jgi:hypothetical protein